MKNRDAEAAVGIDVRVPEWFRETEIYGNVSTIEFDPLVLLLTRRLIGIFLGKVHLSLEVTTIVQRVGIDNHQGDVPM